MEKRIIRIEQVIYKTGFRKTKIYQLIKMGELKPIKLGVRAIGFLEKEIDDWIQSKINATRTIRSNEGGKNA